jgi:hypothetical protein
LPKFEHIEEKGKLKLTKRKDAKDLLIENLQSRLEALEAEEIKRNKNFKINKII